MHLLKYSKERILMVNVSNLIRICSSVDVFQTGILALVSLYYSLCKINKLVCSSNTQMHSLYTNTKLFHCIIWISASLIFFMQWLGFIWWLIAFSESIWVVSNKYKHNCWSYIINCIICILISLFLFRIHVHLIDLNLFY